MSRRRSCRWVRVEGLYCVTSPKSATSYAASRAQWRLDSPGVDRIEGNASSPIAGVRGDYSYEYAMKRDARVLTH